MDLKEAKEPIFKDIFKEFEELHRLSQGDLLALYYKYKRPNFCLSPATRQWEYP